MVKKIFISGFMPLLLLTQCQTPASEKEGEKSNNDDSTQQIADNQDPVKAYTYNEPTIPEFFDRLVDNHRAHFQQIASKYRQLCSRHNISPGDSASLDRYYKLYILHKLFTAKGPKDYSLGPILNIPYLWHWTEPNRPNPRLKVLMAKSGKPLQQLSAPKPFSQYPSYAKIDRTPGLFLKDLCSKKPKYMAPDHVYSRDTFATFGWCSERAMAFVCLMEMMGFEGHVIVKPPHSWSEFLVHMKTNNGKRIPFRVEVDNTYNTMRWEKVNGKKPVFKRWKKLAAQAERGEWYNNKAHSQEIREELKAYEVPEKAAKRIESQVVAYLKERLNGNQ